MTQPSDAPVPARARLCLTCRTALLESEPCDACGPEAVVSLRDAQDLARATAAVWPADTPARRSSSMGVFVVLTLVLGTGLTLWLTLRAAMRLGEGSINPGVIAIIGSVLTAFAVVAVVVLVAPRKSRPAYGSRPRGGVTPSPPSAAGRTGRVMAANGGGVAAQALELWITRDGRDEPTLRDAITPGLRLLLDDGLEVELAAGRLRLHDLGAGERPGRRHIRGALDALGVPSRPGRYSPVPHEGGAWVALSVGDRVELLTEVAPEEPRAVGYRTSEPAVLQIRGVPWLRALPPT